MKVIQSYKTIKSRGSRQSNGLHKKPFVYQGTNGCPIPPGRFYLAGHWFNPCKGVFPTSSGSIESTIGDRSGDAFPGRGFRGDAVGYVDFSSIAGTVTLKSSFEKDNLGALNTDNLTYEEYKIGEAPRIDLTVTDTKRWFPESGYTYHGLHVFENGVLIDKLNCEKGSGLSVYGTITGNLYNIVDILATSIHVEDPDIPYSFLNEKGYNSGFIPASDTNPNQDCTGAPLQNKGRVKLKVQLVDSPCLESNGVWSIDFGYNVNTIEVNGTDVTAQCGIAGSVVQPNIGLKMYDMVVNGNYHYHCADGPGNNSIESTNGGPTIVLTNFDQNDDWGLQNGYHYHANFDGTVRTLPLSFSSKIKFPDTPEMRATDIDVTQGYTLQQIQDRYTANSFVQTDNNRFGNLLIYNRITPGEFPCFEMSSGEYIQFQNTTNWDSITYQGTGTFTIDTVNNRIVCTGSGTIYNIKVYNSLGQLIAWYPVSEYYGDTIEDVINYTNPGTLPNSINWDIQKNFDFNRTYGKSFLKAYKLSSDYPITSVKVSATYPRRSRQTLDGISTDFSNCQLTVDGSAMQNDPDGYPQGWGVIDGDMVFNQWMNMNDPAVSSYDSNVLRIRKEFNAAEIKFKLEIVPKSDPGAIQAVADSLILVSNELLNKFKAAINALETNASDNIVSNDDFFKCLNGGAYTSGPLPNGTNDNFPSTLGIGLTSTQIRSALIQSFDNPGTTVSDLLTTLYNEGYHDHTGSYSVILIKQSELGIVTNVGTNEILVPSSQLVATSSADIHGGSFVTMYESQIQLLTTIYVNASTRYGEIWFRWHSFEAKEKQGQTPAKYISKLQRSTEAVNGELVDNLDELNTVGNLTFKALQHTNSSI